MFIAGDFNAKVGSKQHTEDSKPVGLYGKGKRNSSGEMLIDLCTSKEMCIANTYFQHKLGHRTTWTAPMRSFITHDGTERREPIRNQIDFVIVQNNIKHLIQDARSFGGTYTCSDHKLVLMKINLEEHKIRRPKVKIEPKVQIEALNNKDKRKEYEDATKEMNIERNQSPQERWNLIVN